MTGSPSGSADAEQFFQRVRTLTQDTPYAVTRTGSGFDVGLDIVDARWFGLFDKAGLRKAYVHHVTLPEPGVYTVTDDSRTVEWSAGVPTFARAEREYGRVKEFGVQKVWAFDEQGRFGVQAAYRFNSEEGRDLITGVAQELGLDQRRGGAEKTGLIFAVVGGVGALIAVIAVVVLAVMGKF